MAFPGGAHIGVVRQHSAAPLPVMQLDFLNNATLPDRVTFSRGTGATRVNASGFIETVGNTTPRFDYDPVTLAPRGLLIEEARTNLLLHSADFTNAAYVNSNVTVTANATAAPDGTTTADLLTAAAAVSVSLQQSSAVAATSATYSIFAKQGSGATQANSFRLRNTTTATTLVEITINYGTGAITYVTGSTGAAAVNFGNGWWRITLTATTGITSGDTIRCDQCFLGPSTIGHNAYVWGAGLEAGSFATSYIPTVASTVTRNADVATMTGTNFSSWYNQSEGTFAAQYDSYLVDTSTRSVLSAYASGATANNILLINAVQRQFQINNAGNQADLDGGTPASGAVIKAAGAYKVNDFALSLDGGAVVADAAGTVPTVDTLGIGISSLGLTPVNGHIRTIAYFNTRLPNAQLQTLTAPSLATTLHVDFTSGSYLVGF